jgi:hypothetical protein
MNMWPKDMPLFTEEENGRSPFPGSVSSRRLLKDVEFNPETWD